MIASCYDTHFLAFRVEDVISGTRNRLVEHLKSHKFFFHSLCLLLYEYIPSDEFLLKFAEHAEACHDRGDIVCKFISIQRKPCFEAEGVAAAESAWNDSFPDEDFPDFDYAFRGCIDFKTVLSCISSTAENHPFSLP